MRRRLPLTCGLLVLAVGMLAVALPGTTTAQDDLRNHEEINRRIAWWEKHHPRYTKDLGFTAPVPEPDGKAGIALAIGLDRVDEKHYAGWHGTLEGSENDARAMAAFASARGFKPALLLNKDATSDNVFGAVRKAAGDLQPGDTFMLSFSGNGGQMRDLNPANPKDLLDRTWCLHDRQVLDDEWAQLWRDFKPGVRILVFSDTCHIGAKFTDYAKYTATKPPLKAVPEKLKERFANLKGGEPEKQEIPSPVRTIPEAVQKRVMKEHSALYTKIKKDTPNQEASREATKATVLLFTACRDDQLCLEIEGNGLFTSAVLDVANRQPAEAGYPEFHQRIKERVKELIRDLNYQVPDFSKSGAVNSAFLAEKPFTVSK